MSKRRASVVFDHFYIPDNGEEVCKARCKYCPLEMSFNRKATSNLLNHMKRKHASIPLDPISSLTNQWSPMPTFSIPQPKKWHSTDPNQVQADRALVNLIAGEQLPVSIVESPLFLAFMQETQPSYNVPSRAHFVNSLVFQQYNLLHGQLEALVKAAQSICLTVDIWSGEQGSTYMAVTGHLIIDYAVKSVLFSCKRVRGRQTGEQILSYCESILAIYNMPSKIAIIVSDNTLGSDTGLPGFLSHAESTRETGMREVKPKASGASKGGESTSSSSSHQYVSQHEPSFAHALQLVVRDGLLATTQTTISVLAKVSAMVTHTWDSTPASATDRLEEQPKGQSSGGPCWNRQLKLAKAILADQEEKLGHLGAADPGLTAADRAMLEDFINILRPFEEITDRIQGERVVPASLVIPSIRGIRKHLSSPSEHNQHLVTSLTAATEKWLSRYESKSSYLRATSLDPRLKLRWCEGDQASHLQEDLLTLTSTSTTNSQEEVPAPEPVPPPKKKCLFPFFEDEPQDYTPSPHAEEVETYLQEPCIPYHQDPLMFWRGNQQRFPRLSPLALHYLCIPASPVPALHPDSTRLSDIDFENLMFIKLNSSLL
ncbi:zinc finger BED domain-containing protein 4-like [Megalops cyprinoides]|uniref:zinc finger BED domain-containing protein 4-like n=1 Tax=Megalops cyprinoides TaxID=118141 RepID=UPI0018646BBA|nr:zinc finger BED domain-containing protein 4-like [Megalops cyprinoides]